MLKIVVYDEKDDGISIPEEQQIGSFFIPDNASKEWIERNIPPIIRAVQLLAGKIEETGY